MNSNYTYTVENRLKAVHDAHELLTAMAYDGDGNRVFQLNYNLHTDDDWKGNSGNGNGNHKDNTGSGNGGNKGNGGGNGKKEVQKVKSAVPSVWEQICLSGDGEDAGLSGLLPLELKTGKENGEETAKTAGTESN